MVGKVTKDQPERSPLLPLRNEPDFFVCDVFDAALKGDRVSMEHPLFSLSKKPDMNTRRYENGELWFEVRPSSKGLATVFDRDVLIYCISQCMARINRGLEVRRTLRFKAYDLLVATNRDARGGGRAYNLLREAFDRLQGTQVATNISTGGVEIYDVFSLVDRARVIRETREGRMLDVEITLSDWVFNAIEGNEVLTLHRDYFRLRKPLERRLYELARKHCGKQPVWRIKLEKLQHKCGSASTPKEFRRLVGKIIEEDAEHCHMPDYSFSFDNDMLEVRPRGEFAALGAPAPSDLFAASLVLKPETIDQAREAAQGWDIYGLESQWREWISDKASPKNPDAAFLAFCRKKGKHPQAT